MIWRRYWDIIVGIVAGVIIAISTGFNLEKVQACYSVIILIIVCIGVLRIIKQEVGKKKNQRKHNIIDAIVDTQKPIKAVLLAEEPAEYGENLGKKLFIVLRGIKTIMEKLKTFFSKFKGWMLTIALFVLTLVEGIGGFINDLCGGVLQINGIPILPIVTLVCTTIVGLVSNTFTSAQWKAAKEAAKAVVSAPAEKKNDAVAVEVQNMIKATIKEKTAQLAQKNKALAAMQHELAAFEKELVTLNNALAAKQKMFEMVPRLATAEEVQEAKNAVVNCQAKIADKQREIAEMQRTIETLNTELGALKNQAK